MPFSWVCRAQSRIGKIGQFATNSNSSFRIAGEDFMRLVKNVQIDCNYPKSDRFPWHAVWRRWSTVLKRISILSARSADNKQQQQQFPLRNNSIFTAEQRIFHSKITNKIWNRSSLLLSWTMVFVRLGIVSVAVHGCYLSNYFWGVALLYPSLKLYN